MSLTKELYQITQAFPKEEMYGLTAQIRRAAVSVPSNIAEGQARFGSREFIQYLYIAKGSLAELDTQCRLSHELGYIKKDILKSVYSRITELQRMLFSLIEKLGGSK